MSAKFSQLTFFSGSCFSACQINTKGCLLPNTLRGDLRKTILREAQITGRSRPFRLECSACKGSPANCDGIWDRDFTEASAFWAARGGTRALYLSFRCSFFGGGGYSEGISDFLAFREKRFLKKHSFVFLWLSRGSGFGGRQFAGLQLEPHVR